MSKLLALGLALGPVAGAAPAVADSVPAQYRGYTEINRLVKERIAQGNGFELGRYLGEATSEPSLNGLLSLLGTYAGADTDAEFRNGDPNSINMILWYIALSGLARDVGALCDAPAGTPPQGALAPLPTFTAALKPLCAWPAPSARTDDVLFGYWTAVMSFDAPPEEYDAWKSYFLSDPAYAQARGSDAVAAMTLAIVYHPYFLLRN